ncbi:MAG TPA: NAD(P)/FAD-dependent oxidoreductase [Spirochaetota bacterium]|nr:NAD(P)/FAD-dependent oxidoreductase [Spirochaetota bacterium]
MNGNEKHVVIVGAGFAGLFAVKKFFGRDVRVTLIDRNNYHAFNPLLYQVGAAEIEPDQIAYPLRTFIRGRKNIHFFMASVDAVKFKKNTIVTDRGEVNYDFLILAPGSSSGFFGIKGAEKNTMTLKSLDGALFLRNHIIEMFERATRCEDPEEREKCLSFVIVGGGPTGVEFAGAFAEFVSGPLRKDFAGIDTAEVRISLIDAAPGILGAYSGKSSAYAVKKLERMNIKVILNNSVKEVKADAIVLGGGGVIKSRTILWTAGVVGAALKSDVKLTDRRDRRVPVDQYLRPEGFDNVFICGDLALFMQQDLPLPMIAPVATQQGINAASNILRILKGRELKPFSYSDRGGMVTLGRNSAITAFAGFEFRGFVAWLLWLFIHIFYLIGFRNKLLVMLSWARDYLLYERSGKMIIPSGMKK